jgi:hypothetical protein
MRKFGLSAAAVVALAAPAWAQPPLMSGTAGYADPVAGPVWGYQPGMYAGGFAPPNMLPPAAPPTAPTAAAPPCGPDCGADPAEFLFDPYNSVNPVHRPRRVAVPPECWVNAEWLFWHLRDAPVPAFVGGGNPAQPNPGVPGGGNYTPLVGPTRTLGMLNGARVTVGKWFDPDGELGGELSGFLFARVGTADAFPNSPGRTLGVPFFGTNGTVGVYQYSNPGQYSGSLAVSTANQLYNGEALFLHRWYNNGFVNVDGLLGYRYIQSDESLALYGRSQGIATYAGAAVPPGVTVSTSDSFRARTDFHGLELGTRLEARYGVFTIAAFAKGGLGANVETLRIDGETQATGFGITKTTAGGVYALPSNLGRAVHTTFAGMGEFGTELGVKVTDHLTLRVGYDLLYWTKVLRPGNAVDSVANLAQVPIDPSYNPAALGPRPIPMFRTSDLLANGLVLGVSIDW